jgi:hypothetical protein
MTIFNYGECGGCFSQKILCKNKRAFFFFWLPSGETLPQTIKIWEQAFLFFLFVPVMQVSFARFFFISIL